MLVIFDCDGVLVDSEKLAAQVFSFCLKKYGIQFSAEKCYSTFKGHTLDYCSAWLSKNVKPLPESFMGELEVETQAYFEKNLIPVEGVEKVIHTLGRNNIPFCTASNGSHKKIAHSLGVSGLLRYFPKNRYSRDDVKEGKPAPDLFLFASESMGVPAEFCVVIEDSLAGVQAAVSAGMRVLFFEPVPHTSGLPEEVLSFDRMQDLKVLLKLE